MPMINASDAETLHKCARRYWYENNPPANFDLPAVDTYLQLVFDFGQSHELEVLARLSDGYGGYVEAISVEHTAELMNAGTPLIYQAQFVDRKREVFGKPDFLIRGEGGAYQAADAKLAGSIDKEIGIQLAIYRSLLGNGASALAYLGDGSVASIDVDYDAAMATFLIEARGVLDHDRPLVHYGHTRCSACPYVDICKPEFVAADAVTLLYDVDQRSVEGLAKKGITTIADLAAADPQAIADTPYLKGAKAERAVLQAKSWKTGEVFKIHDVTLPPGTYVHFDIENDPHAPNVGNHVYLWGFLEPPYGLRNFVPIWTDTDADDRAGWDAFLNQVRAFRAAFPDVRFVHYAEHEVTTIKHYAARYQMEGDPTVCWLLDKEHGPMFDIRKTVVANFVLPLPRYGIKEICKHKSLVNFNWRLEESGSQWSIVRFKDYLNADDDEDRAIIREEILTYNCDDVRATRALEVWLRDRI